MHDGYDGGYARAFPSKFADDQQRYSLPGQHYVTSDSEPKSQSHSSKRTRTTSSARRSRKSSSAARDLVRALLIEKIDADDSTQAQLARAYDILRAESQRAANAERLALETAERLKGVSSARAQALQDAARAQAELRAYKLQFENAQQQLRTANDLVAQSDVEREQAVQTVARMKRAVEKYKAGELRRRAMEQGRLEGREEAFRDMGFRYSRDRERGPLVEDDDMAPLTPSDSTMLPIPPPEPVPLASRRRAESLSRMQTPRVQTPIQSRPARQSQIVQNQPMPNFIRRNTTPVNDRSQTPWRPVPPPATTAVRPPQGPATPPEYMHGDEEIEDTLYDRDREMNGSPDHIIIRSPVPTHPTHPPPLQPQLQTRPPRPPSSHGSRPTHISYPASQRHARHQSIDIPAALASESARRIYSQVSSSSSDTFEPVDPPEPPQEVGYDYTSSREPPVVC